MKQSPIAAWEGGPMDGGYSPIPHLAESWTFDACDSFKSRHKYVRTDETLKTAKGTALIYEYAGLETET